MKRLEEWLREIGLAAFGAAALTGTSSLTRVLDLFPADPRQHPAGSAQSTVHKEIHR